MAAIAEIVQTTNKKVLVCAMTNAACDEITERLLNIFGETSGQIFRLYSTSYNVDKIGSSMKSVCNVFENGGQLYIPQLSILQYRVLICTLSAASYLMEERNNQPGFKANHFGYLFIDECASSTETMTLIPVTGKYILRSYREI